VAVEVCIYTQTNLETYSLDLSKFCEEKIIEVYAILIKVSNYFITILCIYRAPSGDFKQFLEHFDFILKHSYKPSIEFICGDFNVNFLVESNDILQ
jgi:hypothetical protein